MVTAIIVAAGKSERMGGGVDKAFLNLGSRPVVAWSLLAFEKNTDIDSIILVVRKDQLTAAKAVARMFGISKLSKIVPGGTRRQDSGQAALKEVDSDTRIVVVHDGARPCVSQQVISDVIKQLSVFDRYYEFTTGIFSLSGVIFFLSAVVIFLFLTVRVLERRRWA